MPNNLYGENDNYNLPLDYYIIKYLEKNKDVNDLNIELTN